MLINIATYIPLPQLLVNFILVTKPTPSMKQSFSLLDHFYLPNHEPEVPIKRQVRDLGAIKTMVVKRIIPASLPGIKYPVTFRPFVTESYKKCY
jgi:hypothetical protein